MDNIVLAIRRKFGITQEELAHVLGVSFTSINAWEGGKRIPQEHMLNVLNEILAGDRLPVTASNTQSSGLRRSDAGFVSSILDYNNRRDDAPYTHGIGRWYGSLPSFLVSDIIKFVQTDLGKSGRLLANFSGSGTVALEAAINGFESYGIDVNPMAILLGKLKTSKVDYSFEHLHDICEAIIKETSPGPDEIKSSRNLLFSENKWFTPEARKTVQYLCFNISQIKDESIKALLAVALATISPNYCNIDKRCTNHYVFKDKGEFNKEQFFSEFINEAQNYFKQIIELDDVPFYHTPVIQTGSACNLPFDNSSMDVVFSHPPYGTTINYFSVNRVPLSIIDSIDFSGYHLNNYDTCQSEDISAGTIARFNSFTEKWVSEAYRVLNDKGIFITVIGDSRNNGTLSHPFTDVINYGERVGFVLKEMFIWVTNHKSGMHVKRKGNHIDHNYVMIMEKQVKK